MKGFSAKKLCVVAMFIALTVILGYISGFLRVGNISKISISFISVYLAAISFGPWVGGFVAAMADFISFIANPTGMYLWQLTILEFVYGFLFGILFSRKKTIAISYVKLNFMIIVYTLIQFAVNIILKTLVLQNAGFVADNFNAAVVQRMPGCIVAVILNFVILNIFERFVPLIVRMVRK